MNVHPAKTELRFRDPNGVRSLIIGALREALGAAGHRATSSLSQAALAAHGAASDQAGDRPPVARSRPAAPSASPSARRRRSDRSPSRAPIRAGASPQDDAPGTLYPLGAARAQINDTFIIAETEDALVIVDQHAAHERLVYERLKRAFANGGISRQLLLIPEVVELDAEAAASLCAAAARA